MAGSGDRGYDVVIGSCPGGGRVDDGEEEQSEQEVEVKGQTAVPHGCTSVGQVRFRRVVVRRRRQEQQQQRQARGGDGKSAGGRQWQRSASLLLLCWTMADDCFSKGRRQRGAEACVPDVQCSSSRRSNGSVVHIHNTETW